MASVETMKKVLIVFSVISLALGVSITIFSCLAARRCVDTINFLDIQCFFSFYVLSALLPLITEALNLI